MQENNNSKKKRIEHLRMILDNPDNKYLHPEDEKYLRLLSKRLKEISEQETPHRRIILPQGSETKDKLEPRVTIHVVGEKEKPVTKIDFAIYEEKKEEINIEDEDIFEVVKVERPTPKFIEVKPKKTIKRRKIKQIQKKKTAKEELMEWALVESIDESEKQEEEIESKTEKTKKEEVEKVFEEVEEIKEKPKKDKKIKFSKNKKTTAEKEPEGIFIEDISEETVDNDIKIRAFKELENIDEKTAILLYDKGYISFEELKNITLKELISIGIKRKKAKQIIKEIQEKTEWQPADLQIKEEIKTVESIETKQFSQPEEEITSIPLAEETAEIEITPEQIQKETKKEKQKIKNTFKKIKNIDEQTATQLYNNGYTTPEKLKTITLKDLKKIGIKRKKAKQIIKEIQELNEKEEKIPAIKPSDDKLLLSEEKIPEETVKEEFEEMEGPVELNNNSQWIPIEEESPLKKKKTKEKKRKKNKSKAKKKHKIDGFKELESIDEKTAKILIENNIKSVDDLKKKTLKDISKIKGLKKKTAESIFKEINKKDEDKEEFVEFIVEDEEIKDDEFKELENKILDYVKNDKKEKITVFKDIKSIDEKTAKILIENGIDSMDILKTKTIKDLVKIKGIRRKIAKQIKRELKELDSSNNSQVFYVHERKNSDDGFPGFRYGEYMLFEKEIYTVSHKKRTVRFFSKQKPNEGVPIDLPEGYEVRENGNGVPYLKKL